MGQVAFLKVAINLRVLQLYYHYCHNLTYGLTFSQDHGMFSDMYSQAEVDYDLVVEYLIATLGNKALDTNAVNQVVLEKLNEIKPEQMKPEEMFEKGLDLEHELYESLNVLDKGSSIGVRNMVGDLAQKTDVRIYKIQQRLK